MSHLHWHRGLFAYGGRVFLISPTTKRKIWGTIPEFRQADKRDDAARTFYYAWWLPA